jgi:hypothetical protein
MFEVGKKYRGKKWDSNQYVTCLAVHGDYAFVVRESPGCAPYTICGTNVTWTEYREPIKVSGWVNVYRERVSSTHFFHTTKKIADEQACNDRIACIYVSGEEGKEP